MIRSLEGQVASFSDTSVVLTIHGVGYLVHTNALRHNYDVGDLVLVHTHLAVRENALDLYGFRTERELKYFELLLTIPKIGPKSALLILSQADPDLIATAVAINDAEHLHKVSGIGKKTASNIVAALNGKIDLTEVKIAQGQTAVSILSTAQADAIDALITLGYGQPEARALILKLDPNLDAKDLIQNVLKQIGTT